MSKEINQETREIIIKYYLEGIKNSEIARRLSLNRTTVSKIITKFIKIGELSTKKRGGCKKILSEEHINALKEFLDEDATMSLKMLKNKLHENFGISCSLKTIDRSVQGFFYSLKRLSIIPAKRNDIVAINKRFLYAQEFYRMLGENDGNNVIFLDEAGFNLSMKRGRGRSLIGKNASCIVKQLKTRNISVCASMSKNGIIHHSMRVAPFNTVSFNNFLVELIEILGLKGINNAILIMDNVPFHKSLMIRNLISRSGHRIIYLPPYSPFLNPIENLFSQWKDIIKTSNCQ
ncbi:hypothetical protein DMUE_6027, partial [Dictyocoela muelleri]